MSIDAACALKNEGVNYPFEEKVALGVVSFDTGDFVTQDSAGVHGTMVAMEGKVYLSGEVEVTLERICDRCAESYTRAYTLPFEEVFSRTPEEEDEESDEYPFEMDEIDLTRMLEDTIVLQVPTASLCTEDCKGLCPVCGINLNIAQCNCGGKDQVGPFGVLAGFVDRD